MIVRVTPSGAYLLQLTRFPVFFPVNCYLVREDDGFTLIDASVPGSTAAILSAAQVHGGTIRRIVLTHAHMDHMASLDALHAALPAAEIMVSTREARFLQGDTSFDRAERLPGARTGGSWRKSATTPTRLLAPGDRVGSLEVIAAPGHTPGQIAFFDQRDRTLIAGDAFQTRGGIAVAGTIRPTFPFPALSTWHAPTALITAHALRALEPTQLAVGHGPIVREPAAAMDAAIATATHSNARTVAHGA